MRVSLLGPVAWRTPPRQYGPWEQAAWRTNPHRSSPSLPLVGEIQRTLGAAPRRVDRFLTSRRHPGRRD